MKKFTKIATVAVMTMVTAGVFAGCGLKGGKDIGKEARDWLKSFYPNGKMLSIKTLKEQKASLQEQINQQKSSIRSLKNLTQDLRTVDKNVEAILHNQVPKKQKTQEPEL